MLNNDSIEFKLQEVTIMADNKWRCRAEDLKGTESEKNIIS